jgi:hypothetical protein
MYFIFLIFGKIGVVVDSVRSSLPDTLIHRRTSYLPQYEKCYIISFKYPYGVSVMQQKIGGRRPGAGRPKGSKNKMTIAREVVAEILDVEDEQKLEAAVHQRGHSLLMEMEQIVMDPTQPVGARIMAAKVALPFMLKKRERSTEEDGFSQNMITILNQRRRQLSEMRARQLGGRS